MEKDHVINLYIMMGLPGSGKTTFSNELAKSNGRNTKILHCDEYKEKYGNSLSNRNDKFYLTRFLYDNRYDLDISSAIIVDGLVLTNDDIFYIVSKIAEQCYTSKLQVYIHRWNEDRETCIKNDGGRREESSYSTIKNINYDLVDIDDLNESLAQYEARIEFVYSHIVCLKPDWERFANAHGIHNKKDNMIRSAKWSTGGTYGNCWNRNMSYLPGDEPEDFYQLDNILEEICPTLTFMQYKQLVKECVSTEEFTETDYYGGHTNYMNWVCDLQKMYELLNAWGYIVFNERKEQKK